jgi:branched-chain amino acid transport system permease protein
MILAALDFQTLSDAVGLGAIYALMAVGIGLVFGVLRLVNFAYGQLVMAGAYTLAFTASWPLWTSILACFAVVVALSLAMETAVFRPLRGQSPAVMLVTTFAIAFLLQAIALIVDLRDDTLGEVAPSLTSLGQPVTIGGTEVRKITLVAIGVAAGALLLLGLLLTRTTIGLHTRAAASDFRTARLLGVRANRVIAFAVVLSGLLAAGVAVMMTVQQPLVGPDFALRETIVVLVGVVVGGIDRLWTATLGGFTIGFVSGVLNGALPTEKTVYLPSAVFTLVIIVLLLRPAGLFAWGRRTAAERAGAPGGGGGRVRDDRLALERGLLPQRPHLGLDRGRDLRLRRQLGRPLVRADQLRRGRCVRGRGDDRAARVEAGRAHDAVPGSPRPHDRQRALAPARRRARRALRLPRRAAADAPQRPRRGHRDLRGAGDHAQHPA